jgi:hypothetical protein
VQIGRIMTRRERDWAWVIGATGGALALAVVLLAGFGTGADGIALGVRMTARWSFLFFWLSYTGGALAILFGPACAGLADDARSLGLAFAASLMVHIGLVVWLGVVTGRVPLQGALLWLFLSALLCAWLLALMSFGIGTRALGRWWRPVLVVGTTYILFAFGRDFVLGALNLRPQSWLGTVEYLPFALLCLIAVPLRLAAFVRQHLEVPSVEREPAIWR